MPAYSITDVDADGEPIPLAVVLTTYEPDRLTVRVGSVEIDLDAYGTGRVAVDGRPVTVTRVEIDAAAGKIPKVVLHVVPLPRGR